MVEKLPRARAAFTTEGMSLSKKKSQQRDLDRWQWTVFIVFNTFLYFCAAKIKEQPTFLLKRVNMMQSFVEPERQLVIE